MLHSIKVTFLFWVIYSWLLTGCSPDPISLSLCDAIEIGDKEKILEFLGSMSGAEKSNFCGDGLDPISFALSLKLFDTADLVIDNTNTEMISRVDQNEWTPLTWASINGSSSSVKRLIEKGASVDSIDTYGYTPLLWASRNGHYEVVKQLVAAGADINHQSSEGLTSLMLSAMGNKPSVVKYLVALKVDHHLKSKKMGTALDIAKSRGFAEIEMILQDIE